MQTKKKAVDALVGGKGDSKAKKKVDSGPPLVVEGDEILGEEDVVEREFPV